MKSIKILVINFPRKEVSVQFKETAVTLSEVVTLLASLGYEPTLSFGSLDGPRPKPSSRKLLLQLGLAGFAFGNVMLISICQYHGLDTFSAAQFKSLFGWVSMALALPVVIFSASDYWRLAWTGLRQRRLNLELPIATGLVALFAWSSYEVLAKAVDGYIDSLCGLVFLLLIGRWFHGHDSAAPARDAATARRVPCRPARRRTPSDSLRWASPSGPPPRRGDVFVARAPGGSRNVAWP